MKIRKKLLLVSALFGVPTIVLTPIVLVSCGTSSNNDNYDNSDNTTYDNQQSKVSDLIKNQKDELGNFKYTVNNNTNILIFSGLYETTKSLDEVQNDLKVNLIETNSSFDSSKTKIYTANSYNSKEGFETFIKYATYGNVGSNLNLNVSDVIADSISLPEITTKLSVHTDAENNVTYISLTSKLSEGKIWEGNSANYSIDFSLVFTKY
ncbi:MAG: hypothetical protein K2H11_02810 [Malacoplasma sp.]|nr:hypothetical protein [Malacoplasma sp.]MDE6429488.1 hypothetical protein [Malacoplasma sp.]